ncbi:unnamed protein product, partial [Brenthis ino]
MGPNTQVRGRSERIHCDAAPGSPCSQKIELKDKPQWTQPSQYTRIAAIGYLFFKSWIRPIQNVFIQLDTPRLYSHYTCRTWKLLWHKTARNSDISG